MLSFRIFTLLALLAPLTIANAEVVQQCQKVIVAGNSQWPPYVAITSSATDTDKQSSINLQGIGIEIAEQIFAELDIPIEETVYSDPTQLATALRTGKIDLIVSTYNDSSLASNATILEPSYIDDPVTVAVPVKFSAKIKDWDSLVGLNGVKELSFVPSDEVSNFFISYLQVANKPGLLANLEAVKNGEYQYIIGSDLQLTYAINLNNLSSDLIVMKNLNKDGPVYMAMASNSPCKLYAVYVQKRLQDYKNNGTVEKIVNKYKY